MHIITLRYVDTPGTCKDGLENLLTRHAILREQQMVFVVEDTSPEMCVAQFLRFLLTFISKVQGSRLLFDSFIQP